MASPPSDASTDAKPVQLKPVIQELIRTQHCGNSLTLLLDRVHIVVTNLEHSEDDSYRIWLSDGTKVIQAVLMPDLHPFLTAGEISEGSYINLTKYSLVQARRCTGIGWLWVIVVFDMEVLSHDGRPEQEIQLEIRSASKQVSSPAKMDAQPATIITPSKDSSKKRRRDSRDDESPSSKRKLHMPYTSSPLKPRPILQELHKNSPLQTPTKSFKFSSPISFESPTRRLAWLEQSEHDDG